MNKPITTPFQSKIRLLFKKMPVLHFRHRIAFLTMTVSVIGFSFVSAQAQSFNPIHFDPHNELSLREVQEVFDANKDYFTSADYVLDKLLTIPEEKRQYYFPAVHELIILPHKITSHPEIIIWKGKKPTVLPPQLKEFAEKHLDALPAYFYPHLDPDKWKRTTERQTLEKIITMPNLNDLPLLEIEDSKPNLNYKVKSLRDSYQLSEETRKNYNKTIFKDGDLARISATLADLPIYVFKTDKELPSQLRDFITEDNLKIMMVHPIREWVKNLKQTKGRIGFTQFLKDHGWQNEEEFITKTDTALKAYRVSQMELTQAMVLYQMRRDYPIKKGEKLLSIQMYNEMYNAAPGDAIYMLKNGKEWQSMWTNDLYIVIGLPISLD
ncbi:MAG: hypothetical protein E7014_03410 [Alphaproteobacteria bacterium]|nr:hypothetical protein [Alphaproteobacteria bacterium]